VESIDQGIWDVIMNGPFIPKLVVDNKKVDKPWSFWIEDEKKKV